MVISERHWGRWELDTREPPALIIQSMLFCEYYILLSLCQSLSQQENWIHHMSEKRWVTPQDLANLRRAFEDLNNRKLKGGVNEKSNTA